MTLVSTPACSSRIAVVCRRTCAVIRLAAQRRAAWRRPGGVVGEAMFDRVAAERGAATGREQRRAGGAVVFAEPVAQDGDGVVW